MAITFYYGSGSPFAWKVWLLLEHKQLSYELKLMSLQNGDLKKPEYLAINPRGKVPTLIATGKDKGVVDMPVSRKMVPNKPDTYYIKPDDVADSVLQLTRQKPSAWSFEIEARPFGETG